MPNVKTGKGRDIMVILEKFKSQKDEIVNRTCLSHKFKGKNVKWGKKVTEYENGVELVRECLPSL